MKRAQAYGYTGMIPCGTRDQITDVPGIKVGHCTLDHENIHTGVTVILPPGDIYQNPCIAACHVQNGFGKTAGLMQIEELGTLETPIALTNTLNVGRISDALVHYMIDTEAEKGIHITTLNPVVGECNDSSINDITKTACGRKELEQAIVDANETFKEGAVGAGRGTICYGLKGGIGSASRIVTISGKAYTFGILVQSNFGRTACLQFNGSPIGKKIAEEINHHAESDKGSIMMILATDCPLSARQLKRVCRRVPNGLARTGSYTGNGSGEVVIGFSIANRLSRTKDLMNLQVLPDNVLDPVFLAASEMCEEAVYNSMLNAEATKKLDGSVCHALSEFLHA